MNMQTHEREEHWTWVFFSATKFPPHKSPSLTLNSPLLILLPILCPCVFSLCLHLYTRMVCREDAVELLCMCYDNKVSGIP